MYCDETTPSLTSWWSGIKAGSGKCGKYASTDFWFSLNLAMYPMWLVKRQIVVTWTTVTWKSNLKHMHCTFVKLFFFLSFPQHDMSGCLKRQMNFIRFKKGGVFFTSCTMYHYPNCSSFDLKTGVILEEQTLRCSVNCRQANHSACRANGLMHTDTNKLNPVCINQNAGPRLIILAHTPSRFDQSSKTH